jgi:hypothetical protein
MPDRELASSHSAKLIELSFILTAQAFGNYISRPSAEEQRQKSHFEIERMITSYVQVFCFLEVALRSESHIGHEVKFKKLAKGLLKTSELSEVDRHKVAGAIDELLNLRDSIIHGWIYTENISNGLPLTSSGAIKKARKSAKPNDQAGYLELDFLPSTFGIHNWLKLVVLSEFILTSIDKSWVNIHISIPKGFYQDLDYIKEDLIYAPEFIQLCISMLLKRGYEKDIVELKKLDLFTKYMSGLEYKSNLAKEIGCFRCKSILHKKEQLRPGAISYKCFTCGVNLNLGAEV